MPNNGRSKGSCDLYILNSNLACPSFTGKSQLVPTYLEDLLHAQVSQVRSQLVLTYPEDLLHAQISQVRAQLVPTYLENLLHAQVSQISHSGCQIMGGSKARARVINTSSIHTLHAQVLQVLCQPTLRTSCMPRSHR